MQLLTYMSQQEASTYSLLNWKVPNGIEQLRRKDCPCQNKSIPLSFSLAVAGIEPFERIFNDGDKVNSFPSV